MMFLAFLKVLGMSLLKMHKWLSRQSLQWDDKGGKREGISSAPPQLRCPRCRSTKTEPVPVQMGFYRQCQSCGNVWDTRDVCEDP